MGVVYLAEQESLGRPVAHKVIGLDCPGHTDGEPLAPGRLGEPPSEGDEGERARALRSADDGRRELDGARCPEGGVARVSPPPGRALGSSSRLLPRRRSLRPLSKKPRAPSPTAES